VAETTAPPRPDAGGPQDEPLAHRSLGQSSWPELADLAARAVLVLPLGSLEQHGPHLPLDTDTTIAGAIAERLAAVEGGLMVGPALAFGASGEHAGFEGTLSIGTETLVETVVELVRSARGSFDGVVVISAHGGNATALAAVERRALAEGDRLLVWQVTVSGGDAHAGRTETSLLLALDPAAVRPFGGVRGRTEPLEALWDELQATGVRAVSPNGVLGDPAGATAAEGWRIFEGLVADARRALVRWRAARETA
jgi:creatinine amidohydrolase